MKIIERALVCAKGNPGKKVRYATLSGNFDIVFTSTVLDLTTKCDMLICEEEGF